MDFLKGLNTENIMLLNTIYHYPKKREDGNYYDYLDIVYKNLVTNDKHVRTIENPEMDIYVVKPEHRTFSYNQEYFPIDKLDRYRLPYKNLNLEIANILGKEWTNYVKECYKTGNRYAANSVHQNAFVFGSDYPIDAWYRIQYLLNYGHDKPKPITKCFLDIEADLTKPGAPINAVTVIDQVEMTSYTFLLRDKDNPLIREFENDIDNFKKELNDDYAFYYGEINYRFLMFDEEKDMLTTVFKLVNKLKRDFLLIWNISYDIPKIIERMKKLGVDPIETMCSEDFKIKELYFKKDTRNFQIKYKADFFKISSYTTYIDQMLLYAGLRKGSSEIRSYALNYIAELELQDKKLNYDEVSDFKSLPYANYRMFVKYNIKDVLLQLGLDKRTGDVDNVYLRAYSNAAQYEKIFRQTKFLNNSRNCA
jgi:hypothetical protein